MSAQTKSRVSDIGVPPSRIELRKQSRLLELEFADGEAFSYSFEFLRVFSPSAEVRGHSEAESRLEHGKRDIDVDEIEPVGNYAVRLRFSDGHATGIYSWQYLREIGRNHDELWSDYLRKLKEAGLGRNP